MIFSRRRSKKQQATRAARIAAQKAAKAKAVQKAPKTAAAVWTGRRSGKLVRGVALGVAGAAMLKAIRGRRRSGAKQPPEPEPSSYRATPTPASSQQTSGDAGGPSPAGPTATEQAKEEAAAGGPANPATPLPPSESATPPHGDKLEPKNAA